jgi:predicted metalloprotease with PDZ domain
MQPNLAPNLSYTVAMPQPENHLFIVTLEINGLEEETLDLKMPVWTPGSYLIREYARLLQDFQAVGEDYQPLPWQKKAKNHWQVDTQKQSRIQIRYRIFANDLTVRTNHLDSTHGYFNGAAIFLFIPGLEKTSLTLTVIPPYPNWRINTTLQPHPQQINTFIAEDFDTLVDSPVEVGIHKNYRFEVLGKPHELVIWGEGNIKPERVIEDTKKVIQYQAKLFNGLPYERYTFLLHLSGSGYGGLEHKSSCTLNYPRFGFRAKDSYHRFIQLVAHEFFHLWNVKRIRPQALEVFDYEQENYTPSLWFSEGVTSYYDILIPLRTGVYDTKVFLENLSKDITTYLNTPGRQVQPLRESSFDAWIKLYRRDTNSNNAQISYYLKGELVALLLDLLIRQQQPRLSLDTVMQSMWEKFGQPEVGFTPADLQAQLEAVAGRDLSDFYAKYLDGLGELPFDEYFLPFGLQLKTVVEEESSPYLGIKAQTENGKEIIKFVESQSPAQLAGIDAEDELLAINGIRVSAEQLNERLKDYRAGDMIAITVFHQDELRNLTVQLAIPKPSRYEVVRVTNPSNAQKQNFAAWTGSSLS